jgi:O-antigen/teichoic acid export membrane protein
MIDEIADSAEIRLAGSSDSDLTAYAAGVPVALVSKVLGKVVFVLGQILLARILGPASFGLYAVALTIFTLVNGIGSLGLENGVMHFAAPFVEAQDGRLKQIVLQALGLGALAGLLSGGAVLLAAGWLAGPLLHKPEALPLIQWFAIALPLSGLLHVLAAITRISRRMEYTLFTEDVGQPALQLLLMVIFYFFGYGLTGFAAASAISYGLMAGLALFFVRRIFRPAWAAEAQRTVSYWQYLRFSVPSALAAMFSINIIWIGRLLVAYFRPVAEIGIYQAASQLAALFPVIVAGINTMIVPLIPGLAAHPDKRALETLYKVSVRWALILNLPLLLIVCVLPTEILGLVFGKIYAAGSGALLVLAVSQLVNVGTGPVGSILIMAGYPRSWALLSAGAFVFELVAGVILTPQLGFIGAAVAVSLATTLLYIAGLILARRMLGIWPYDGSSRKLLVPLAVCAGVLLIGRGLRLPDAFPGLVLLSLVAVAAYASVIYRQGLDAADRELIRLLKKRLRWPLRGTG